MITDLMKARLDWGRLLEAIGRNDPRPLLCGPGRARLLAFRSEMGVRKTVADLGRAHSRAPPPRIYTWAPMGSAEVPDVTRDLEKLKGRAGRMREEALAALDRLGLRYLVGEA
jgi:hypothetical protein